MGYDLKGVRAGQKVKPIYLTKLPKDLNTLGDTKKKRELFIKIILPLILDENEKITEDRKKLFKILGKNFNTVGSGNQCITLQNVYPFQLQKKIDCVPQGYPPLPLQNKTLIVTSFGKKFFFSLYILLFLQFFFLLSPAILLISQKLSVSRVK